MAKILVADKLSDEGVKILQDAGFTVDCKLKLPIAELVKIIPEYAAVIVRSETKITAEVIGAGKNLKVIGRAGVGVDTIDIEAATKHGVIVMNAPGGNTISTCEQAWALMLACARNTPAAHASTKKGEWERSKFKGIELYSKTLGIVGLGRIGKEVAKRAIAFGMNVMAYDPFVAADAAEKIGVKLASLDELMRSCDFITLHTALTDETKHLIGAAQLALMKKKSYIINCARGELIDQEALYQALKDKKIAGAALDVFPDEPPTGSKLLELDNVVLTPHLGASTEEAQFNVAIEIAQCVKEALAGKAIRNAVNYVQLDPETYKAIEPYFNLAEKMGKFLSQIIEGGIKEIQIDYLGEISNYKTGVIGSAFIKGFLSIQLEQGVNYINAMEVAKERNVKVEQTKRGDDEEYISAIRVKVITDKEERLLEGTLFSNKEARFVKVDKAYLEIAPSAYMLVFVNWDKPGTIGFLGTVLGSHNINIAGMSLGRIAPQDKAFTILNVDSAVSEEVKREIISNPNIISLKAIRL